MRKELVTLPSQIDARRRCVEKSRRRSRRWKPKILRGEESPSANFDTPQQDRRRQKTRR